MENTPETVSFQYAVTTDAFTAGPYSFSAQSFTINLAPGWNDQPVSVMFGGSAIVSANHESGLVLHGDPPPLDIDLPPPGSINSITAWPFVTPSYYNTPTQVTNLFTVIVTGPEGPLDQYGNPTGLTWFVANVHGTLTETVISTPEPGTPLLLLFALLVAFVRRRRSRHRILGQTRFCPETGEPF